MRFATRLQTGEALVYSDEFAEATHVTVTPVCVPPRPARSPRARGPVHGLRSVPVAVRLPRRRARHGARPDCRRPHQG